MLELRDSILINAPPDDVWAWLEAMPEHYVDWHPDHVSCRWLSVGSLKPTAEMEIVERLHGKEHRFRIKLTRVERGRRFDYQILPGLTGSFEVEASDTGSAVSATIYIGFDVPVIGLILDTLLRMTIGRQIDAIRRHQLEEGANL